MSSDSKQQSGNVAPTTHDQFNDPNADLVFRSADGVLFRIHRVYLNAAAGAFPPDLIASPPDGEWVDMAETAATLELLFAFVHPRRHPTVDNLEFDVLVKLGEAAEKYEVFAAMNVCLLCMRSHVEAHPIAVLNYAAKHGYNNLADKAAFFAINKRLDEVACGLELPLLARWLCYYQKWLDYSRVQTQAVGPSGGPFLSVKFSMVEKKIDIPERKSAYFGGPTI